MVDHFRATRRMRSLVPLLVLVSGMSQAGVNALAVAPPPGDRSLQDLVRERRRIKQAGLAVGGAALVGGMGVGLSTGIISSDRLVPVISVAAVVAVAFEFTSRTANVETRPPLDEVTHFEVRRSVDPAKGEGLFALRPIEEGTYLFAYDGELLDEDAMFARYPEADGRYIACINDDLYIDGIDPSLSNMARWMNHASAANANVFWKKQRRGAKKAMHFYALRAIAPSEELCFDYGSDYWDALGVKPID